MQNILTYCQIGLAVILTITILLQQRGGGMGAAIGGSSMEYSTKRGAEKAIFYTTIVVAVLFIGISVARLLI